MTTKPETQATETRDRRVAKPYTQFTEDEGGYTILAEIPGADETSRLVVRLAHPACLPNISILSFFDPRSPFRDRWR